MDSDNPLAATFTRPNGIALSKNRCSLYITQDENVLREIKFFDGRCDQVSHIEDLSIATKIRIFPNPSSGLVQIENPENLSIATIEIFDLLGRQSMKFNQVGSHLDISKLEKGVYTIILSTKENNLYREKLLVN